MNGVIQAIRVELLKARRSKVPLLTALVFTLPALAGGFFMVVIRDPDLARQLGLISAKAQLVAGSADWETYLGELLTMAISIGGVVIFGFIVSWVFGREYADRTVTDLLALPTSRSAIVLAKFVVVVLLSVMLTLLDYLLGLGVGTAIHLPPLTPEVFWEGTAKIAVTSALTFALLSPIAFFASMGRGYLLPIGVTVLVVILAQIVAAAGWGQYFPWSIPALQAGLAGPQYTDLGAASYIILGLTSLAGVVATFLWWELADQR